MKKMTKEDDEIGKWLSAALEDSYACREFKQAIINWFNQFKVEKDDPLGR
jgi:disulfide oxidoreductase YuzD